MARAPPLRCGGENDLANRADLCPPGAYGERENALRSCNRRPSQVEDDDALRALGIDPRIARMRGEELMLQIVKRATPLDGADRTTDLSVPIRP
jgi:hypothetical protein